MPSVPQPLAPRTLAVMATGMQCGLGRDAPSSCAAIRCGVNNFSETRFLGSTGEWLIGSAVETTPPTRGVARLAQMAAQVFRECLAQLPAQSAAELPVLLCIAEPARPGRPPQLDATILPALASLLGTTLHEDSRLLARGRVGGVVALRTARRLLAEHRHARILLLGVDSLLTAGTMAAYDGDRRLLRPGNTNGFIPGEAAAGVVLTLDGSAGALRIRGVGFGREPAPLGSGRPLRADGLVAAMRNALAEAGLDLGDCDHRIGDLNGERYRFKEAALAITRLLRRRKVHFSIWHPADCIGEVGAASLPAMLAVLEAGARRRALPGVRFIGHLGNDDDLRAAFVAEAREAQPLALEAANEAAASLRRRAGGQHVG